MDQNMQTMIDSLRAEIDELKEKAEQPATIDDVIRKLDNIENQLKNAKPEMTKEEILSVKSDTKRRELIKENLHLFKDNFNGNR